MADVSPGELQTLVATLQGVTQQLGNIAKAITTGAVTRAGAPSGAMLGASPPSDPLVVGYLTVQINGQTVKIPYYTS
jgi:hypothetical protein